MYSLGDESVSQVVGAGCTAVCDELAGSKGVEALGAVYKELKEVWNSLD
jgi:hypothetical protein